MKTRVCIIEDEQNLRNTLKKALLFEGFQVEEYSDGYPLFEKVSNWPDIFILDIELPGINGLEICKWIKGQSETNSTPVIYLSGSPELEVLAANTKAEGYLAKPVKIETLLDKIYDVLAFRPSLV